MDGDSESVQLEVIASLTHLKSEGNELFQVGQYEQAVARYTEAVKLLPDVDDGAAADSGLRTVAAVILCNRAAALLSLRKWVAALASAQAAEAWDPTNWKAPWRQGLALMGQQPRIERSEMAIACFQRALASGSMPQQQRADAQRALSAAQARLRDGRDAVPLPENCVLC
eukprot:TRINITY_DN31116_c0_g1_i1.p1 TRINITY_DN31116_c0_g1~~TRINITY_DN31116_c0_g1_i1.p1  ORF type:complete len:170 (+),score=55.46 TRINITY_DN31116_c0_g1_i1:152-661(+)